MLSQALMAMTLVEVYAKRLMRMQRLAMMRNYLIERTYLRRF
jgi:hypothetical protein